MKKTKISLIFIFLLCLSFVYILNLKPIKNDFAFNFFNNFSESDFCYVLPKSKKISVNFVDQKNVECGDKLFLYDNLSSAFFYNADYVQLKISTKDKFNNVLKEICANLVFEEEVSGCYISYYFVPSFLNYKIVKNHKINLVVAKNKECIVVGYPFIFASF